MQIINTSDGLFRDGNPASGEPGTIVPAVWLNSMQTELQNLLGGLGGTPDPSKNDQLKTQLANTLALKAPLASPALTGTPSAPSATSGTNTTQLATTAFVQTSINGRLVKSVAGGANVTLTSTEAGYAILEFNGALTANIAVIMPNAPGQWIVRNATSGAYTLTVRTASGSGTIVVQSSSEALWCDGSNVMEADASKADKATTLAGYGITDAAPLNSPVLTGVPTAPTVATGDNSTKLATTAFVQSTALLAAPPGQAAFFFMATPPAGWLKANGAAISRTAYAALFAAIGTTYGIGDGLTTFNLPDLRGEFVRSADDGRGVDSGRAIGSWQKGTLAAFDADGNNTARLGIGGTGGGAAAGGDAVNAADYSGLSIMYVAAEAVNASVAIGSVYAGSTRPRNVALLACIKY